MYSVVYAVVYVTAERNELIVPSIEKAVHKIVLGEYSVLNIYENFGRGDFSPGKIEFGVVVVRFFLVVRILHSGG